MILRVQLDITEKTYCLAGSSPVILLNYLPIYYYYHHYYDYFYYYYYHFYYDYYY